ncbi:HEAT repeat domain-containing protein [Tundrisphaera lichenicola]|uniref:HEAT repeat domain-containing protein n=1 Tax=Tundrisphaera lichenicola TaxID=2029860 RepID=UPI003EBECC19
MRLEIPRLRMWHLIGLVAAAACFFAVMQFRTEVEDDGYRWMRRLRSLDAAERAEAAGGLGSIRPPERRAIAPLTEALFDSDARVRDRAASSLGSILGDGKDDPEADTVKAALTRTLADPDPEARLSIARTLAILGAEPDVVVPTLVEFSRTGNTRARFAAINHLGFYARESEPALAALFAGLEDTDPWARASSVASLGYYATYPKLGPLPLVREVEAALEGMADDPDPQVRANVVRTFGRLGGLTGAEYPVVIEALDDPDVDVRQATAAFLGWRRTGPKSPALVPSLIRALKDPDVLVRQASARTLGHLRLDAEPALPSLRELAGDPDENVRREASEAVATIEKAAENLRSTILTAVANLEDADPNIRALGADQLGDCGPMSPEAVPALVRCLDDREANVRIAAARALGRLGPSAAIALPDLARRAESDDDERVRQASALSRSILLHEVEAVKPR